MLPSAEPCSDRDSRDSHSAGDSEPESSQPLANDLPPPLRQLGPGLSGNTGPKGVLADFRAACAQLRVERLEKNARMQRLMETFAVGDAVEYVPAPIRDSIRSDNCHPQDISLDEELEAIRARRLTELRMRLPEFGQLISVEPKSFIDLVENSDKRSFVVISLYKTDVEDCHRLNFCLESIAPKFSRVRFAKMSINQVLPTFDNVGLPALVVYQAGHQIHSFVPLSKYAGDKFFDSDIVRLLCRYNVLSDEALTNSTAFDILPDHDDADLLDV